MFEWLILLRSLLVVLRGRLQAARRQRGAVSLEYVVVVIGALAVAGLVFTIIRSAARSGANSISIPGN
jgi:hypothetical protein